MRGFTRMLVLAAPLALGACESIFGPGNAPPPPLTDLPRALSTPERALIGASNHFAFDLLREVSERDTASNVFLSPLSASMALGMTMNGARGDTFEGMRSALGFGTMRPGEINTAYRSLIDLLRGLDRSVEMRIGNSIWVRRGFPLHDGFVRSSQQYFDASVTVLDFDDPSAPRTINAWVDRSTNGKIKKIVPDEIDGMMVMYLINAIYFKGSWTSQFDRSATQEAMFRRADGSQQRVHMMHLREGKVRALRTPEVEIVDLPYGRDAFSMTLVLPSAGRTLDQLVASLDAETWDAWMGQLREGTLDVFLPRFRLEYQQGLVAPLAALGMETAFNPGRADFSGMSPASDGLYISEVTQKTYVDVNEEGTEAAAVTSVGMRVVSAPPSFRADRPFLAVIRERLSGTILFVGAIGAPPSQ